MNLDDQIRNSITQRRDVIAGNIVKGKPSMPIGTISNGRKKIAEGQWRDVVDGNKKPKQNKEKIKLSAKVLALNEKHQLSRLPIDMPHNEVIINKGEAKSNWILKWIDPKTQKAVTAYSKAFLKKNAQDKWKRIENVSKKDISAIKIGADKLIVGSNAAEQQSGAIVSIISQTGLRPGSRSGFNSTQNRGVSTLAKKNIKIEGSKITFEFKGKSYKNNTAEINDSVLANYLSERMSKVKGEDSFIFNTTINKVRDDFKDSITPNDSIKLKDMRTYIATDIARDMLMHNKFEVPQKGAKKAIQGKLMEVFKAVSNQLNNSPTMAKTSYIHPNVINEWLQGLGVKEADMFMMKAINYTEALKAMKLRRDPDNIEGDDNEDFDDIDEYNLPDWWDPTLQ